MEIGEAGDDGKAAVGAVVVVQKLVLENAITLLQKMGEILALVATGIFVMTHMPK